MRDFKTGFLSAFVVPKTADHSRRRICQALWALLVVTAAALDCAAAQAEDLEAGFRNPPAQARPHTFWHWMNGNVSREGITADLEAMARVGVGGVMVFNVAGSHACDTPPGPIDYMSPAWLDLVRHTAEEADRLGLEVCMQNCAGWSTTGGPWIKPEHAMQALVSTELTIDGGRTIERKLEQPAVCENYYRDIAVYAYPTPKNDGFRVEEWRQKAGQRGGRFGRQPDLTPAPADAAIDPKTVRDVTERMRADGTLVWDVPPGRWTIVRLGHTPTGMRNHPSPDSGRGLEVDKLARAGLDVHWREGIQPVLDRLGPLAGKVFKGILVDSYEAGLNHWTPRMREEFRQRRGYDPGAYLLALTGRLVGDGPSTDRFLWDFRRTIADLFADNYYGYFADLCHSHGLQFAAEPYTSCFEGLAVAAKADLPMSEFWADGNYSHTVRMAASIAHTHGRPIAGAEAFTAAPAIGRWQNHPGSLKRVGDLVWTQGINRLVLHRYAHQPWLDLAPGMTLGQYGCHFERTNTWWEQGRAWMQYIARSQFLLQSGEFAADALVFGGNAAPNLGVARNDLKAAGYDYDGCGTDIMAELKAEGGYVVLPCGKRYRLLVLPDTPFQTPAQARKVRDLVRAGAAVLGPKPLHTPSLSDFPASEQEVRSIGETVWGECDGRAVTSNRFGRGVVFAGIAPAEALARLETPPAVQISPDPAALAWIHRHTPDADIFFVSNQSRAALHAVVGFLAAGRRPELWDAERGVLRPATGWIVSGKHVRVPLDMAADDSIFVVFRHAGKPAADPFVRAEGPARQDAASRQAALDAHELEQPFLRAWTNGRHVLQRESGAVKHIEIAGLPEPVQLSGPWTLRFAPHRGAPAEARFDRLASWAENSDPGIRYFSGTAANSIQFDLPEGFLRKDQEVWLDLGDVAVIAEVRLNGQNLGILWRRPFRVEASKALRPGPNTLQVNVTNLWINRLIGDEHYPDDCEWTDAHLTRWPEWLVAGKPRPSTERVAFTTWKHWRATDPLRPSGLLGPVALYPARLVPLPAGAGD